MLEIILGGGCIVLSLKCAMLLHELEETRKNEERLSSFVEHRNELFSDNFDLRRENRQLRKSDYKQAKLIDDLYKKIEFKDKINLELVKINAQLKDVAKLKNVGGHRTTIKSGDDNE